MADNSNSNLNLNSTSNSNATEGGPSISVNKSKREGEFDDSDETAKKMKSEASRLNESKIEDNRNSVCSKNGCKDANGSKQSFEIEADAAEDKGSRHTMEDAWVVLPDASNDTPGKLRFPNTKDAIFLIELKRSFLFSSL